jgi:hypothetical protein
MGAELISISKAEPFESEQVSVYQEMVASGKIVARPMYDKQALLVSLQNSTNARCIDVKASVIAGLGYKFKDEENAKTSGVIDFTNNLYGKDGSPKPLSLLAKEWIKDFLTFADSRLEIVRIGKSPVNLLVLSGKNTLISVDRKSIYQWDRSRNKVVEFRRYGQYSKTIHDTLCLTNVSPEDDYYGVPCYASAIPSIKENIKIVQANLDSLDNIIDPSLLFIITGHTLDTDERDSLKTTLEGLRNKRSSAGVIDFNEKDTVVNVQNYGAKATDGNYLQEREAISIEVMSLHGLTPELFGVLTNGGISSGEKATGALKIFVQTTVNPIKEVLERLLTDFFINEFPKFSKDNAIIFNSIDLTDSNEDATTELTKAQTNQAYIDIGSKALFNEYRVSIGLPVIDDNEWNVTIQNRSNGVKLEDMFER